MFLLYPFLFLLPLLVTGYVSGPPNHSNHLSSRSHITPSWSVNVPPALPEVSLQNKNLVIKYWSVLKGSRLLVFNQGDRHEDMSHLSFATIINLIPGLHDVVVPIKPFSNADPTLGFSVTVKGKFFDRSNSFTIVALDLVEDTETSESAALLASHIPLFSLPMFDRITLLRDRVRHTGEYNLHHALHDPMNKLSEVLNDRKNSGFIMQFKSRYQRWMHQIGKDEYTLVRNMLHDLTHPSVGLFTLVNGALQINSHVDALSEVHLPLFRFVGNMIGISILKEVFIDLSFVPSIYKSILQQPVGLSDLKDIDLQLHDKLQALLDNEIPEGSNGGFMTTEYMENDKLVMIDLVENGSTIPVVEATKHTYVDKVCKWHLEGRIRAQLEQFRQGIYDEISLYDLRIFDEQELGLVIAGDSEINVVHWQSHTTYLGFDENDPVIRYFWKCVEGWDKAKQSKLLEVVTGTKRLPISGFKGVFDSDHHWWFMLRHTDMSEDIKVSSDHYLIVPRFKSYEEFSRSLESLLAAH